LEKLYRDVVEFGPPAREIDGEYFLEGGDELRANLGGSIGKSGDKAVSEARLLLFGDGLCSCVVLYWCPAPRDAILEVNNS
jgi:hypothetical protein